MKMNFLKRFGKFLSDDDNNCSNDDNETIRKKTKQSLLNELEVLYPLGFNKTHDKHLIIWIDVDATTFKLYDGFEKELNDFFSTERGFNFATIELRNGKPNDANECRITKIRLNSEDSDFYIQELSNAKACESTVQKAYISIFDENMVTVIKKYELSAEVLKSEKRKFYNIGRGEFPITENGQHRHNHIVIEDDGNNRSNRHVSRSHARIGYSDLIGFYLQVELGGSRLTDNRTRIIRGEDYIEVESLDLKVPLMDGDIIELGKAVNLKYEIE